METQPGAVNWSSLNNFLNRGEARAMAWQAIGHGADDVNYWQWRSALNGQEEIHGVLVGPDGTPVPFLDEVSQTAHEFAKVESSFRDTAPLSQVALLYSYDSHWAIQFQKHTEKYDDIGLLKSYYRRCGRFPNRSTWSAPTLHSRATNSLLRPVWKCCRKLSRITCLNM
jgi:beta-galactosidase